MRRRLVESKEFILYLCVGVLNTLFGFSVYALFIYSGIKYYLAVFFSTFIGIFFSYFTIGRVVFNAYNNKNFIKFLLLYIFLFFVNITLIKLLLLFNLDFYLSGFISMIFLALFSFGMNKYFVFNKINT